MRFVFIAAVAAVFVTAGLAQADAPAPTPALSTATPPAVDPSDPQTIFAAARGAWNFTSYPRYANYVVGVSYTNGAATVQRHYDTLEDLRRSIVFARSFSREENANPSMPASGINIGVLGMTMNVPQDSDPIGPLALSMTYDFGISLSSRPTQVAQLGSQVTSPDRYVVIGRTGETARIYNVRLIEMLDNGATYHLGLTPVKDPKRYRIREMWVTAKTFITQKILISANFSHDPYVNVPWLVTFKQIDGGPYIDTERAQGPLDFGDAGQLTDVTITFTDLKPASDLPAYGTVGINGGETTFVTEP